MDRLELHAQPREESKREVKAIRAEGWVPGVVYGPKVDTRSILIKNTDLLRLLRTECGETGLIDFVIEGDKSPHAVLIQDVQIDPVTSALVHIDLFEVDLTEPVDVTVPIELEGESPAVEEKRGMLLQVLQELDIRVLPNNIPPHIGIDISGLNEVGDQITLEDLSLAAGIEIMVDNLAELVVKIEEIRTAEQEEEALAEAEAMRDEALGTISEGEEEGETTEEDEETDDNGESEEEGD